MRSLLLIAAAVLVCAGCATTSPGPSTAQPRMPPEELCRYYDYPRVAIQPTTLQRRTTGKWTHEQVEFELQLPPQPDSESIARIRHEAARETNTRRATDMALEYTVRLDFYRPRSEGRHPLVVLSTILGGNNVLVDDFARYFAAHGMCTVVVHRRAANLRRGEGLEGIEANLRRSVLRVRQAIDWAEKQPGVDPSRMASFGISYGAIINATVAGAEPRLQHHIFALGGGNVPDILMSSTEPKIRYQIARVAHQQNWTRKQTREELHRVIKSDPLNSAPLLDRDRVLMIVAQLDAVVGTRYENLLWLELGKPRRIVVPLGHSPTALAMPLIRGEALRFLEEKFGMPQRESVVANYEAYRSKRY